MKTDKKLKHETIIRQYKAMVLRRKDAHLRYCLSQKSLVEAIDIAAKAVDDKGKKHNHQRRIPKINLANFSEKLKAKEKAIKGVKSFDDLMTIIEGEKCERIGELTIYDTATRIAAYLNIFPDKIYLHSGTRTGAKKLLGTIGKRKYLSISDLPLTLTQGLSASELEDILCIFKRNL